MSLTASPESPAVIDRALRAAGYVPDPGLATAVFLSTRMGRALLLEGAPGVGKTELAKQLAALFGRTLVRLQCYEGIDASQALYDWNYARQLLVARVYAEQGAAAESVDLYSEDFLVERPLLRAARLGSRALLLVDEVDRADEELEAFLLEFLAEGTITIPELGTIGTGVPPLVVVTSNRTRELHDALRRRCLYHWVDLPDLDRETEIIRLRTDCVDERLAASVAYTVARIRELRLAKPPGVAESIDWARALAELGADEVTYDTAAETISAIVKTVEDTRLVRSALDSIMVPNLDPR